MACLNEGLLPLAAEVVLGEGEGILSLCGHSVSCHPALSQQQEGRVSDDATHSFLGNPSFQTPGLALGVEMEALRYINLLSLRALGFQELLTLQGCIVLKVWSKTSSILITWKH